MIYGDDLDSIGDYCFVAFARIYLCLSFPRATTYANITYANTAFANTANANTAGMAVSCVVSQSKCYLSCNVVAIL